MPLQLITPPTEEPVSLAEAKLHLRVDFSDDDTLISSLIAAARQAAEMRTGRQLVTARWKLVMDSFPGPSLMGVPAGTQFSLPGHAILCPKCPVQSVVSIQYLDMASTTQTMTASDYTVDAVCEPGRITPVFGKIWPITLPQIGAVWVTFDAGYGAATAVPDALKTWIKLQVGAMYENREAVASGRSIVAIEMPFVDALLRPFTITSF